MKTIGAQAKEFRLSKKWNTSEMAAAVEKIYRRPVSRQKIEQLEDVGDRRPRYLFALAQLMGATVEDLELGRWSAPEDAASADGAPTIADPPAALQPRSPGPRWLVMRLADLLLPMEPLDRKQAAVILKELALAPEQATVMADSLERLLGGPPSARGAPKPRKAA